MIDFAETENRLRNVLSEKRFRHTMGVTYTAAALAFAWGADPEKARIAGLLHDCAKWCTNEEKIRLCDSYGIQLTEAERSNPELSHAKLGAYLAQKDYGLDDAELLSAIRYHTTGRPGMTLLEKIIFIADYIEPNRNLAPNLSEIRRLAFSDPDRCICRIMEDTLAYLKEKNYSIDQTTQDAYDYYIELTCRKDDCL